MIPAPQNKPARRATYWGPAMTESQYAVFYFDVQTMCMQEGQNAPLIFDSLAGAERHARDRVAAAQGLGCRILDSTGRVAGTFLNPRIYERFHGLPAAKRSLIEGIACLFAAAVKIIDGASGLMEHNGIG